MMKVKNLIWLAVALPLLFAACKRDVSLGKQTPDGSLNITDPNKLVIPANFTFGTYKDLTVKVKVEGGATGTKHRINIYIDEPATGKLTTAGMTDEKNEYTAHVRVAVDLEYIYIEKVETDGSKTVEKVKADKYVNKYFKNNAPDPFIFRKASSGWDCNSGCGATYNNTSTNVTVSSGIACFTGIHTAGSITMQSGTITKICASGYIDSIILNGSARVFVLDDAQVTIGKILFNSTNSEFTNWSDSAIVNGCITVTNTFENHGKLYTGCTIDVTSTGSFNNFGFLSTAHNLIVSNSFENYDHVMINGSVTVATTGTFNNYCTFTTKSNFTINGTATAGPSSYVKVVNDMIIPTGGLLTLDNNTMLSTKNLTLTGTINGTGATRNILKVSDITTINSGGEIKGYTDLCDNNGIDVNNGTITSPARIACSGFIAQGSCNSEGFGYFVPADADSDGVPDLLDDYPNDAHKAFNQFFPCATTCSNIVFEDLWPSQGDFDFNDLVVAYNVQKIYNAQNEVVGFNVKIKPRAVGAGYTNAFGFSLDELVPGDVQSVSGQVFTGGWLHINPNGTEQAQTHAVIIGYDSPEPFLHRAGGSMFNTIQGHPYSGSDTCYTNVVFVTGIEDRKLDFVNFNPFLIAKQNRGYEIHLPDRPPTDLVNAALFGTSADRSIPSSGRYYKNANGMPWALEIHETFDYPKERANILSSYNYFDDWAMSGGGSYPNWYRGFGGYRTPENIY